MLKNNIGRLFIVQCDKVGKTIAVGGWFMGEEA